MIPLYPGSRKQVMPLWLAFACRDFFLPIYIKHNIENTESENQLANLLTNGPAFSV